jgi:hypothetical protein
MLVNMISLLRPYEFVVKVYTEGCWEALKGEAAYAGSGVPYKWREKIPLGEPGIDIQATRLYSRGTDRYNWRRILYIRSTRRALETAAVYEMTPEI